MKLHLMFIIIALLTLPLSSGSAKDYSADKMKSDYYERIYEKGVKRCVAVINPLSNIGATIGIVIGAKIDDEEVFSAALLVGLGVGGLGCLVGGGEGICEEIILIIIENIITD